MDKYLFGHHERQCISCLTKPFQYIFSVPLQLTKLANRVPKTDCHRVFDGRTLGSGSQTIDVGPL